MAVSEIVVPTTTGSSSVQEMPTDYVGSVIAGMKAGKYADDETVDAEDNDLDDNPDEPIEESGDADEVKADAPAPQEKPQEDTLEYFFTDESGKRQSAKVNLSDREALKKELSLARGARKWQAERDKANSRIKELEPEYTSLKQSFDLINSAYEDTGLAGVVNLLLGDKEGYSKLEQQIIAKATLKAGATPEQLEKMDLTEKLEQEARKSAKLLKDIQTREEAAKKAAEEAETRKTEAIIHPVFDQIRFAGKLGDPLVEDQLDAAVWQQGIKELEALPDETVLTKDLVEGTFKKYADSFNKVIKAQTETKVTQELTKKKVDAQTKVAASAKKGAVISTKEDEFRKDVQGGNILSAFRKALSGK